MTDKEMKAMAVEDKRQDVVIAVNLPNKLSFPRTYGRHLDHVHVLEELHAAVVLITVHPGKDHRIHLLRQLNHRWIHLDTRPAMFEPHVQNNQLMVKFVVVDELLHVLPRVKLNHTRMTVAVVQRIAHQLVWLDPFFFMDFLHGLVEAKVRDFGDFTPLTKLPGLVQSVTHHEDEFYIVASPRHLENSLYQEQQWPW
ncbi:hypothetical protein V6N11_003324 [Hibiscus sabdariffa]|uniref:Uncharacterized protein n=1 Tax=Hibiscus sabdariffa TaxID=183260 RepID=A0ABR2SDJ8_9ROSI